MTTSFTAAPLSSGAEPSAHLHQEALRPRVASWSERIQRMAPAMLFASAQRAQLPVDYFETKSNESVLVGLGWSYVLTSRAEGPERFATIAKAWNALAQGAIVAPAGGPVQPLILGGFSFDPT
ncbi:MAG: hypothetical protein M1118_04720, partial [Chloroflexi bacterium]|nr:hypothetical protein [Chloroflexota bacterium]